MAESESLSRARLLRGSNAARQAGHLAALHPPGFRRLAKRTARPSPLAPCFQSNGRTEPIRTGRGDEGEWGRDEGEKHGIAKKRAGSSVPHSPCIPAPRGRSYSVIERDRAAGRGDRARDSAPRRSV